MQCAYNLVLCPVQAWGKIIQRILKYPPATPDTYVSTFLSNEQIQYVKNTDMNKSLRAAAYSISEARLGFKPSNINTHSLCSGATMSMYLAGVPVYTIMLIGRWSSDAFLKYIRKQVEQFSHNVSRRIINILLTFPTSYLQFLTTTRIKRIIVTMHKHGNIWVVQAPVF